MLFYVEGGYEGNRSIDINSADQIKSMEQRPIGDGRGGSITAVFVYLCNGTMIRMSPITAAKLETYLREIKPTPPNEVTE